MSNGHIGDVIPHFHMCVMQPTVAKGNQPHTNAPHHKKESVASHRKCIAYLSQSVCNVFMAVTLWQCHRFDNLVMCKL